MYACMYICMHVCIDVCVCMCMCMCMYIHTYIHTYMAHIDYVSPHYYFINNLDEVSVEDPRLLLLFKKLKPKVWHSTYI